MQLLNKHFISYFLISANLILCEASLHNVNDNHIGDEDEDFISDLPGLPDDVPANLVQYSGYLHALDGNHLHYWLV